ncbi:unnamed protein product [Victoria cruziana]
MKEAIRTVPESIVFPEFPDTSNFHPSRGYHSALRRIKEEWGTSCWFLEFDIRKCFHTIDRHRLIPILKEEIDDPKRLVGGEKGPCSVPHNVLLSALLGNIYPHKLNQEIGRIRQKHEIPIVQRIRSVLLRTSRIDDQSNSGEEAFAFCWVKSIQRKAAFHSLVSSWHTPPTSTPRRRGDQKTPFVFPPSSALAAFLNKPSSLLCATFLMEVAELTLKAEFYGRECCNNNNGAMRDLIKYCKRRDLLIELGGEAILAPLNYPYLIRICYAQYADDSLLGIVGAVELIIEIQKRITHFLQSTARSTVEFPGMVIREVPSRTTPIPFFRELEKHLRVKHRIHITTCHLCSAIHSKLRDLGFSIPIQQLTKGMSGTGSLLDAVQLAETLGTAGVRSQKVSVCCIKHIRQGSREIEFLHSPGQSNVPSDVQQAVSRSGKSAGSFRSKFPIWIEAPIKKILRRLRDRGLISWRRPWPTHVAYLTNVSDGDIVNRSAGIAISPLSYYRCRDNLYQVRTIVEYQIRWFAIFTPAHKHKSSVRNIIPKYPKDSHIVNQEGGQTLAGFPNSIELGKLRPGQDPNNKEHSTTIRQSIGVTSSSCIF